MAAGQFDVTHRVSADAAHLQPAVSLWVEGTVADWTGQARQLVFQTVLANCMCTGSLVD